MSKQKYLPTPSRALVLADVVRSARQNKGWAQIELSRRSRVSTRTIVAIERGEQKSPRQEVVVRLARALEADPAEWLHLAGYENIDEDKINQMVRASGGFRFRGEIDPAEFFKSLSERLGPNRYVVVCVAYPSSPGSIHRADIQRILLEQFQKGLCVALTCPYPQIGEIGTAKHPSLVRHYREVFGDVVELAREMRGKLEREDRQKQLAVFVPRRVPNEADIRYPMPLAGLTEYRPTLVQYSPKNPNEDEEFELASWVTLMQEKRDRWIQVYPATGEPQPEDRYRKLRCWRDYFAEILIKCDVRSGNGWKKDDFEDADWEMVDLQPAK